MSAADTPRRDDPAYKLVKLCDGYVAELWPFFAPDHELRRDGKVMSVDFVVYNVFEGKGWGVAGGPPWEYQLKDSERSPDPTNLIDMAEWFVRGGVRWDGCIDLWWGVGVPDNGPLHRCSAEAFGAIADMFIALYEAAAKMMGRHADRGLMGLL